MPTQLRTILFDFDYTLADSSTGVIACTNFALEALGLPVAAPEEIRQTIGLTLEGAFAYIVGKSLPLDRFSAASKAFDRLFIAQADAIMADHTVILPHVAEAIYALRRRGFALGVVSSKFRYRIEHVLEREDLRADFDVIVGREDVIASKPDPEGMLTAMSALGGVPANTCYVGDSATMPRPRSALRCRSLPCFPASPRGQHSAPTLSTPSLQALPAFLTQSRAGPYSSTKLNEA